MGHGVSLQLGKWSRRKNVAMDSQDQKTVALCPLRLALAFPSISLLPLVFDQLLGFVSFEI